MSRKIKALTLTLAGILTLLIAAPWTGAADSFIPFSKPAAGATWDSRSVSDLRLSLLPLQITAPR